MDKKTLPPEITKVLEDAALKAKGFTLEDPNGPMASAMTDIVYSGRVICELRGLKGYAFEQVLFHAWMQVMAATPEVAFENNLKARLAQCEETIRIYRQTHELHGVFDAQQSPDHRPSRP